MFKTEQFSMTSVIFRAFRMHSLKLDQKRW